MISRIMVGGLCAALAAQAWCSERDPAAELRALICSNDRSAIAAWSDAASIAEMNAAVRALSSNERMALAQTVVLTGSFRLADNTVTAMPAHYHALLVDGAAAVLASPILGFYVELFAHTVIRVHTAGGGAYAAGDHVSLSSGMLDRGIAVPDVRNTLAHELFHIFNARTHASGGISGLNEGTAIWVFKTAFYESDSDEYALGLAEPTFGTINFYRDIGIPHYPRCIPLGVPSDRITQKGRDVYAILMQRDPSMVPIFDAGTLQRAYDKYFRDLNRNQDFGLWLKACYTGVTGMVAELRATGTITLPAGFTNKISSCPTPPPR